MTTRSSQRAAGALASTRAACMLTALDLANSVVVAAGLARRVGERTAAGAALAAVAEAAQAAATELFDVAEALHTMTPAQFRAEVAPAWWRRLLARAREAEQAPHVEDGEPGSTMPALPPVPDRPVFLIEDL